VHQQVAAAGASAARCAVRHHHLLGRTAGGYHDAWRCLLRRSAEVVLGRSRQCTCHRGHDGVAAAWPRNCLARPCCNRAFAILTATLNIMCLFQMLVPDDYLVSENYY